MGLIPAPLAKINRFFLSYVRPVTSDITGLGPTENYIQRNHSNSGCKQTLLHLDVFVPEPRACLKA